VVTSDDDSTKVNYSVVKRPPVLVKEIAPEDLSADELDKLIAEKERLEREIEQKLSQEEVKNRQSNVAAKEGGIKVSLIDEELNELMSPFNNTISDNGDYLNSLSAPQNPGSGVKEGDGVGVGSGDAPDNSFKGRNIVEYKFENPVRNARIVNGEKLIYVPAYRGEHSGVVEITAYLNRDGEVVNAYVSKSSGNKSLDNEALAAAKNKQRTRFDISPNAPEKHKGTITYTFVGQ
jgi:TonB family protein